MVQEVFQGASSVSSYKNVFWSALEYLVSHYHKQTIVDKIYTHLYPDNPALILKLLPFYNFTILKDDLLVRNNLLWRELAMPSFDCHNIVFLVSRLVVDGEDF